MKMDKRTLVKKLKGIHGDLENTITALEGWYTPEQLGGKEVLNKIQYNAERLVRFCENEKRASKI